MQKSKYGVSNCADCSGWTYTQYVHAFTLGKILPTGPAVICYSMVSSNSSGMNIQSPKNECDPMHCGSDPIDDLIDVPRFLYAVDECRDSVMKVVLEVIQEAQLRPDI